LKRKNVPLTEASELFTDYLERKTNEQSEVMNDVRSRGFTARQADIISDLIRSGEPIEVSEVASKYRVSNATARRDLLMMVDRNLVVAVKRGHKILY